MRAEAHLTWYALITAPQREVAARIDLEAEGQRVIVPMEPVWRPPSRHQNSRDYKRSERPLIPGYAFAGVNGRIPYEIYRTSKAYRDVVKFAGIARPVNRAQLQAILDLVEQMEEPPRPGQTIWRVGQHVKVFGRRRPIIAVLKHHVRVMQEFLGAMRPVDVPFDKLEAIPQERLAVNANQV